MYRILSATLFATAIALPAAAAPTSSSQQGSSSATSNTQNAQQATPQIAAKLRQSLTQAGFTDIHVMPESFLVRAKDSDGNPVMMVVNPDSLTAVTALGMQSNGGHGSSSGSSGANSASNPANGSGGTTHQ